MRGHEEKEPTHHAAASMHHAAASVLAADASDWYARRGKFFIIPVLLAYILHALATPAIRSAKLSISGDSGLTMDLKAPLPEFAIRSHAYGAMALVVLVLIQKQLIGSLGASGDRKSILSQWYPRQLLVHRRLGYCILLACGIMDGAGYYMGRYSAFPSFQTFSVYFALPFAVWLVLIPITAKLKYLHTHRLLSNMLVKGCIATPLSRLGGAHLQRLGWETASGYYVGIFGVACVIGLWQLIDIYYYLVK